MNSEEVKMEAESIIDDSEVQPEQGYTPQQPHKQMAAPDKQQESILLNRNQVTLASIT